MTPSERTLHSALPDKSFSVVSATQTAPAFQEPDAEFAWLAEDFAAELHRILGLTR